MGNPFNGCFGLPSASLIAARQAERAVVSFDGDTITIQTKAR
jgi:hypothetical protein